MTIRQFKFTGSDNSGTASGTITINGIQVFSGDFSDSDVLASGSIDVDDALAVNQEILLPTVINVTAGTINVALTQWNYGATYNPVYTPEQVTILENPATTNSEKLAIVQPLATPPLSSADITVLESTDPNDVPLQQEILKMHGVALTIQDPAVFDYGWTATEDFCNRENVLLDGVEPADANTNAGLLVTAGQTLTYDSIVFASNIV